MRATSGASVTSLMRSAAERPARPSAGSPAGESASTVATSHDAVCSGPLTAEVAASGRILEPEVQALAASPNLAGLGRLHLHGNQLRDKGARALAASPHLGRLTSLDVGNNGVGGNLLGGPVDAPTLARLQGSPTAPTSAQQLGGG